MLTAVVALGIASVALLVALVALAMVLDLRREVRGLHRALDLGAAQRDQDGGR